MLTLKASKVLRHIPTSDRPGVRGRTLSDLTGLSVGQISGVIDMRLKHKYVQVKREGSNNKKYNVYTLLPGLTMRDVQALID